MKKLVEVTIPILLCAILSGCASEGGAIVTGPLSYMNARRIDTAKMTRSVAASNKIAPEKKAPVIQAVNMSMSAGAIAAGYQVDVLALMDSQYTWTELFSQLFSATGDLAAEAATGYAIYHNITKTSNDSNGITVNGNGNFINQGRGTVSTGYVQPQNGNDNVGGDVRPASP